MAIEDHLKAHSSHNMLDIHSRKEENMKPDNQKTIHSGHFMISRVHDPGVDEEDEYDDKTCDSVGYDFMDAMKETSKTYRFGPRSTQTLAIDASLTKLFQCLTLAYSGKITSPKWKPFRGMHLTIKDKIRLNNIIWREWHLQYLFGRKPTVCQFATPLSDDIHTKPEAVVLEGKYWKRRLDTVTAEYKNWRRYFKDRVSRRPLDSQMQEVATIAELLERVKEYNTLPRPTQPAATDLLITNDLEDMDFTDNLFFSLKEPFQFPNPREFSQLSCADLIQPGLIQLQPNLDDFMDVDTVHDMIMNTSRSSLSSLLSGSTGALYSTPTGPSFQSNSTDQSNLNLEEQLAALQQSYQEPAPVPTSSLEYHLTHGLNNNNNINNNSQSFGQSSMVVDMSSVSFGQNQNLSLSNLTSNMTSKAPAPIKPVSLMGQSQSQPPRIAPRAPLSTTVTQSALAQPAATVINKTVLNLNQLLAAKPAPVPPTNSIGMTQFIQQELAPHKKDGFVVPVGKPVQTPRKQRNIAPAPPATTTSSSSSSPSMQSTYLAQLLTKGTYPGAIISVKKEPVSTQTITASTTTYQPIRPAEPVRTSPKQPQRQSPASPISTVTNISPAPSPTPPNPIDLTRVSSPSFPTSVLIAAASEALRSTTVNTKDVICVSPKPSASIFTVSPVPESPASPQLDQSPRQSLSPLSDAMSPLSGLMSPSKSEMSYGNEPEKVQYQEQRRVAHLSAEQKRRCNLKSGFDVLHTLIPALSVNPKVSKAAMLQKTADYCKKLKSERSQMQKEAEILKQEIETLNTEISVVQSQLPETGVPVTRQRVDQMKEMFDNYVRSRTLANWKFWIFSIIIGNLFDSFNNTVSTASVDELCRTVLAWLDQNCSLVSLRPTVLNALRHLSTTTSILTEPGRMKEQATQAVTKGSLPSPSHTRS